MKSSILLILILALSFTVFGQKNKGKNKAKNISTISSNIEYISQKDTTIRALTKFKDGKLLIRWAPVNSSVFENGLIKGYFLEKMEMTEKGKVFYKRVSETPIMPISESKIESLVDTNDQYQAAAAGLLYGKKVKENSTKNGDNLSFSEIVEMSENQKIRHFYALSVADMSPKAAQILGLYYEDPEVIVANFYSYRIYSASASVGYKIDTSYFSAYTEDYNPYNLRIHLNYTANEKKIHLNWEKLPQGYDYSGYFIEKSENLKEFKRINELPYLPLNNKSTISESTDSLGRKITHEPNPVYNDSTNENYKYYYYRLIGIDPFGDLHIASDTLQAYSVDRTSPGVVENVKFKPLENGLLQISWTKSLSEGDLAGFVVQKGLMNNEQIEYFDVIKGLLPPKTRTIVDSFPNYSKLMNYVVYSVDTVGNYISTLPNPFVLEDVTPPENPISVTGKIDSNGVILINWKNSISEDIKSYQLYYAYSEKDNYFPFENNEVRDTFFIDTLKSKTYMKEMFVRICAIDLAGNKTKASKPYKIIIPDFVAPIKPTIRNVKQQNGIIFIDVEPSMSQDANKYRLYKKTQNGIWNFINEREHLKNNKNLQLNDTIKKGKDDFYYAVSVTDFDNNESEKTASILVPANNVISPPQVQNLKYIIDKETIILLWDYPRGHEQIFRIYKAIEDKPLDVIAKVENQNSYKDPIKPSVKKIKYIVRAESTSGGVAEPVSILIEL